MSTAIALPAGLNRQFGLLERRLWRMDALVAGAGGLGALLLSYALEYLSDRIWDTPQPIRFLLAVCGWCGFLFFAWRYGNRWIWGRRSIRALAVIVQKRYRRLGDRLLGIVELADPSARPSNYSPELCAAAIAQVAGEAAGIDFQDAARDRTPRRYLYVFLGLAALVPAMAVATPEAAWNAALRWFWPLSNIERYTFVTLDGLPDYMVVAQGEPFEFSLGVSRGSFWKPRAARAQFAGSDALSAPIVAGSATFHLPGQTQQRRLWINVGDVTRGVEIMPEVRPDLRAIQARIELPSYLQYPVLEKKIEGGTLEFLPGTKGTFTGEAVRPLASAKLQGEKKELAIKGADFTAGPLLLELERDLTFTWRDSLGLDGAQPETVHAVPREDEPPAVELRGLAAAIAMLPEETVAIDIGATDDYGVRRVTLAWQTAAASPDDAPGPLHEIKLADGKPQLKTLSGHYDYSPALLQVQPDTTILVRGMAIDYFPYRQPASTPIYKIHVLSRESHARLIHDQFEKLQEQLEELTRKQEAILQAGKAVRAQDPKAMQNEENAQKLAQQSNDQKRNADQLKELAKNVADTLAEALRNPMIAQETLKDWANHAEQMNQLAQNAMPQAAQTLDQSRADPQQRQQKLDSALQQEQAIVQAMREMEQKVNQNLESMAAQTLAARLRRAAGAERQIGDTFHKMLQDTIGMTASELSGDAKQSLTSMSSQHTEVTRETGRLEEEISRLFNRTSLNRYGDVAKEMDEFKTTDGMTALGGMIDKNIGATVIGTSGYWADQFEKWAGRLEQQDNSQAKNSNAQQSGQPDPAQMQALMALMRMRQQQEQLREQTTALEEQKGTNDDYASGAADAATRQSALRDQAESMASNPAFPIPPASLKPVGKSMSDAAGLLAKPETGHPTYDAQTDALNLLDAAIAQQAQKAGASASALMAMMGMGAPTGGGNTAGDTTDKPNVPIPGSREGNTPDQRAVIQAGGLDNSQVPGEFRDAVEGYEKAMERGQ